MPEGLDRAVLALLVAVHAGLLFWALAGLAELLLPGVPWPAISNPLFGNAMLAWQWLLVAGAALTFLAGAARGWPGLPMAMAGWYAVMAATCAWQTFFILEHAGRFRAMALEYVAYAMILAWLFLRPGRATA